MADIDSIKRIYKRLARVKAGEELQAQITWLTETFVRHAEHTDDDSSRVNNTGFQGQSSGFEFPDSTPQERADALDKLLTELEAELAGALAPSRPGFLVPIFCAPR
jgi:hypothetical protein